jgi:hypothetical protein
MYKAASKEFKRRREVSSWSRNVFSCRDAVELNNINISIRHDVRLGAESSNAAEEYAIRSYLSLSASYYSVILLANNKLQHYNSLQYMIKISFRILYYRNCIKQKISCAVSYARPLKHHQQEMEECTARVWVNKDGVWIDNGIYWTLTDRNYN